MRILFTVQILIFLGSIITAQESKFVEFINFNEKAVLLPVSYVIMNKSGEEINIIENPGFKEIEIKRRSKDPFYYVNKYGTQFWAYVIEADYKGVELFIFSDPVVPWNVTKTIVVSTFKFGYFWNAVHHDLMSEYKNIKPAYISF